MSKLLVEYAVVEAFGNKEMLGMLHVWKFDDEVSLLQRIPED